MNSNINVGTIVTTDVYVPSLRLAFEFQGGHHYHTRKFLLPHMWYTSCGAHDWPILGFFNSQRQRKTDAIKRQLLCNSGMSMCELMCCTCVLIVGRNFGGKCAIHVGLWAVISSLNDAGAMCRYFTAHNVKESTRRWLIVITRFSRYPFSTVLPLPTSVCSFLVTLFSCSNGFWQVRPFPPRLRHRPNSAL